MAKEATILYQERQHFKQVWLWVMVAGIVVLVWAGFVYQVVLGGTFGNRPVSDIQLALLAGLVGLGLPYFFYKMQLQTVVVPGELQIRFYPFHLRPVRIPLHLVRDYERTVYNPITDYGGWGIRWGFAGKAYNMSGNEGVKLYFYNHKPLLVGSQQPRELYEAIRLAKEAR